MLLAEIGLAAVFLLLEVVSKVNLALFGQKAKGGIWFSKLIVKKIH